ncbi:GSCOCG00002878001-RA-CDS, partial [Cotesia congregata]
SANEKSEKNERSPAHGEHPRGKATANGLQRGAASKAEAGIRGEPVPHRAATPAAFP